MTNEHILKVGIAPMEQFKANPASLTELSVTSGRAKSNLSRTLKTMERYGIVYFEKGDGREVAPRVNYSGISLEMSFA
jgi:predicted transcriptional regulator